MKYIIIIIIVVSCGLHAQDTSQINTPLVGLVVPMPQSPSLSALPSAQELTDLFVSACGGEMNPLDAVALVASRDEKAIPGLRELLFSETHKASQPRRDQDPVISISNGSGDPSVEQSILVPNKLFVVLALEAIGTSEALAVLLEGADTHPNPEIRSLALNALCNTFYTDTLKTQKGNLSPDKAIIRVLINSAEDTTYIGYLQKHTDQIAQEGLVQWLGKDFGDPQFDDARTKDGKKISVGSFRKIWLEQNEANLIWNNVTRHFSVKGR